MTGPPTAETPRLRLRPPEPSDVDALFAVQGDPQAMRSTWCAPDREATARFVARHAARFAEDGYAPWTAVSRGDGRILGWGGLCRDPDAPYWGPEIAYFLHPACWGRGLATELVRAALALAFDACGLEHVSAFARPENRASTRVLAKAGFARVEWVPELARDRYALAAHAWRTGGGGRR